MYQLQYQWSAAAENGYGILEVSPHAPPTMYGPWYYANKKLGGNWLVCRKLDTSVQPHLCK